MEQKLAKNAYIRFSSRSFRCGSAGQKLTSGSSAFSHYIDVCPSCVASYSSVLLALLTLHKHTMAKLDRQKFDSLKTQHKSGLIVGLKDVAGVKDRLDIDVLLKRNPKTFNLFLQALQHLKDMKKSEIMSYYQIAGRYKNCSAQLVLWLTCQVSMVSRRYFGTEFRASSCQRRLIGDIVLMACQPFRLGTDHISWCLRSAILQIQLSSILLTMSLASIVYWDD